MALEVILIPVLADNYMFLLHDKWSGETACVDPADAEVAFDAAQKRGLKISRIFLTHKHSDHVTGALPLKKMTDACIFGPEKEKIKGVDVPLHAGDTIKVGSSSGTVIETPGHTQGHIVFHFGGDGILFSGDALFVLGCGRLCEGTPEEAWAYMKVLRALPPETQIYSGHEYTAANLAFAQAVDPYNAGLMVYEDDMELLREAGKPCVPSNIAFESMLNPFLRADHPGMMKQLNMEDAAPHEVFALLREKRDKFRFP